MLVQGTVKSEFWKAVKEENIAKVKEYVKENAEYINARDRLKNTPLHYALLNDDKEMIDYLMENGADLNAKNNYGKTPFHIVVEKEDIDIVKLCIEKGANVNLEKFTGESSLDIATERENKDLIELLLKEGALPNSSRKESALHKAVYKGSYEIVEMLLKSGANPIALNKSKNTPLSIAKKASYKNKDKIIRILNKYATPRHAVEKRDNATLRESLQQYTRNEEQELFKRTDEFFDIENYLDLLKKSKEVADLVKENKESKKRLKEINDIFKKGNISKEVRLTLKEEEKNKKVTLRNNREILTTIKDVQKEVDDLARLNIVHLMCSCLHSGKKDVELEK